MSLLPTLDRLMRHARAAWTGPTIAALAFAAGVIVGWLAHREVAAGRAAPIAASAPASDAATAHAAEPSAEGLTDGGTSAPRSAAGPIGSEGAPRGSGDVAVVGGDEASERVPATGAGAGGAASETEGPEPRDGGTARVGRLDRDAIRDVVRAHRDELGFCFAWQLHRRPELGGRIVMDFVVGEDGSVISADVAEDRLGDETVLRCFRSVTRRMRFPAPEGGVVRVRYPFLLSSEPAPE